MKKPDTIKYRKEKENKRERRKRTSKGYSEKV